MKSLDDSQQQRFKRNAHSSKAHDEILCKSNTALPVQGQQLFNMQSYERLNSSALPPFTNSLLLVRISSPSSSYFLSLLYDRLWLVPASAYQWQKSHTAKWQQQHTPRTTAPRASLEPDRIFWKYKAPARGKAKAKLQQLPFNWMNLCGTTIRV